MTPRANVLCCALIGLCSLLSVAGCAPRATVPPAPVLVGTAECPAPQAPVLPELDAALFLDDPANIDPLLERDDLLRQYIKGLRATVRCYESQTKEP